MTKVAIRVTDDNFAQVKVNNGNFEDDKNDDWFDIKAALNRLLKEHIPRPCAISLKVSITGDESEWWSEDDDEEEEQTPADDNVTEPTDDEGGDEQLSVPPKRKTAPAVRERSISPPLSTRPVRSNVK